MKEEQYEEPEFSPEEIQEMENEIEDSKEEDELDDSLMREENALALMPQNNPENNQHTFLDKATFQSPNTTRTSFLSESELGNPDFSVRFLRSIVTASRNALDDDIFKFNKEHPNKPGEEPVRNIIAEYFEEKVQNVTESGMSKEGFTMKLNSSRIIETMKKRANNIENLKGGRQNEQRR